MSEPCDLLFVYGTLLADDRGATGRTQRARLLREGQVLGAATVDGLLYNLGRYPGLVQPAPAGASVRGEVLRLADPARSLAWLDAYEGIVPGQHPHNDYDRRLVAVTLAEGPSVHAWAYIYRGGLEGAQLVPGGSWLTR